MPEMSIWDKVRLYGGAITGSASSFVTGACIGLIGKTVVKNPIARVIWYIGGTSIGVLVGKKVESMFEESVTETEEAVTYFEEVRKTFKDAEEV